MPRTLPAGPVQAGCGMKAEVKITGLGENTVVNGDVVGPFVVHSLRGIQLYSGVRIAKWGVTHAATGYNAAYGPTKVCCMHAARRLRDVDVDWSFTDPAEVRKFAESSMEQITVIRAACAVGGEA